MADAFIGEIRLFAGNFPPVDWAFCNGQLLPISQNTALFSILGTQFGGDGQTTFALPNMQGTAPMNQGAGQGLTPCTVGQHVGSATVTLDTTQIPAHNHVPNAIQADGGVTTPANNYWAEAKRQGVPPHQTQQALFDTTPNVSMSPYALSVTGSSQPHNNMQPYLALNFIICLNGMFPSRG